jgi:hypothetical protein
VDIPCTMEADALTVYGEYAKTNNLVAVSIYLFCLLAAQTAQIGMLPSPASLASACQLRNASRCRSP